MHLYEPKSFSLTSVIRSLIRILYPETSSTIWCLCVGKRIMWSCRIQEVRGRGDDSTRHSRYASDPFDAPISWIGTLIFGRTVIQMYSRTKGKERISCGEMLESREMWQNEKTILQKAVHIISCDIRLGGIRGEREIKIRWHVWLALFPFFSTCLFCDFLSWIFK